MATFNVAGNLNFVSMYVSIYVTITSLDSMTMMCSMSMTMSDANMQIRI